MWTRWNSHWETLDGRLSGVAVDGRVFEVHTFRDGQCVRKVDFRTRSEALEAAGLRE